MKKILVPIDFSVSSKQALDLAVKFARLNETQLILMHSVEPRSFIPHFFEEKDSTEKERRIGKKLLEKNIEKYPEIKTVTLIKEGKPYQCILEAARETQADAIFMGSWGSHAFESGLLGSNVYKVIREATCPVIIVSEFEDKAIERERILIPVDTTFGIKELRELLHKWSGFYTPHITLFSVVQNPDELEETDQYLKKQKNALIKKGITDVKIETLIGKDVQDIILKYVADANPQMIWMETHGRSGLSQLFQGSVTESLLRKSVIPILCLRPEREPNRTHFHHSTFPI